MLRHINSAFWDTNVAMRMSKIPLVISLVWAKKVSTGWGGVGQASRHAEVFLRGETMLPCFVAFVQVESTSMGDLAPHQTAENAHHCSKNTRALNESSYNERESRGGESYSIHS